ncbi:MAG: ribosome maturation factor RimP [Clostridiales bacterium]
MEKKQNTEARVERCIAPLFLDSPYEIYDIEYVKEAGEYYLRIYIDKDGGIDLDDCEKVTDLINTPLDEMDPIPEAYYLEVSSPGIERKLKTAAHFAKVMGEKIYLKFYSPFNGKKEIVGILQNANDCELTLDVDGENMVFPFDKIAKANLSVF